MKVCYGLTRFHVLQRRSFRSPENDFAPVTRIVKARSFAGTKLVASLCVWLEENRNAFTCASHFLGQEILVNVLRLN